MKKAYPLVTTHQYLEQVPQWLNVLRKEEHVSVLFFPKTDRLRRMQQMMEDIIFLKHHLGEKSKYVIQMIDFSTVNIEDRFDMQEYLTKQLNFSHMAPAVPSFDAWLHYFKKHNIRLILILYEAEKYLSPSTKNILSFLSSLVTESHPYVLVLSFYEMDITNPQQLTLLPSSTNLYDNLFYYPLYSQEDTLGFVRYLQNKWSYRIDKKTETDIVERCGGHFWLVKQAVREYVETGHWSQTSTGLQFRLNSIYNALLPSEQNALEKIFLNKKKFEPAETHALLYFRKMNALDKNNQSRIPLLHDYIANRSYLTGELTVEGQSIILNTIPIDKFFSRKEHRVLKMMLERRGSIVSRDIIAQHIWPIRTTDHYSDWAIDQTIARIRSRLQDLSLPSTLIRVVRGKGYIIEK